MSRGGVSFMGVKPALTMVLFPDKDAYSSKPATRVAKLNPLLEYDEEEVLMDPPNRCPTLVLKSTPRFLLTARYLRNSASHQPG